MEKWAAQELQYAELGDTRRNKRLISIVENLASQPSTSVPQASGNLAAASATYDFWNSPYFQPSDIIAAQAKSTVERIKEHSIVGGDTEVVVAETPSCIGFCSFLFK
jgi:hypothetical protein